MHILPDKTSKQSFDELDECECPGISQLINLILGVLDVFPASVVLL